MKRTITINLKKDGSFNQYDDKIYQINVNEHLLLRLDSKKFKNFNPILLTSFPKKNNKDKFYSPKAPIITENIILQKKDLQNYNLFQGSFNQEGTWECEIKIQKYLGSFQLQVVFVDQSQSNFESLTIKNFGQPEWIVVQPQNIKNFNQLNNLNIQTVLPYSLGKMDQWFDKLSDQCNLGYKAFHFPPLNELGISKSYYCIYDHFKLNSDIFENQHDLLKILSELKQQHNCLFFTDILLNHVSCNSEWLKEDIDAFYNIVNTPQLNSALQLDIALQSFSQKLLNQEVQEYQKGLIIENLQDVDLIVSLIKKYVYDKLEIEKYFQFDIQQQKQLIIQQIKNYGNSYLKQFFIQNDSDQSGFSNYSMLKEIIKKNIINLGIQKYYATLNYDNIIEQLNNQPQLFNLQLFIQILEEQNYNLFQQANEYVKDGLMSIKDTIIYLHLKKGIKEFSKQFPILPKYFTKISENQYAANNGWIMDQKDVRLNFAECDKFYYLRRQIVIWEDNVKLRFGSKKQDSPKLWKRMKKYVQQFAGIFDGFRIDNTNSTPIHVGEYFLKQARKINNELIVFSELFTVDVSQDCEFYKKLGINAIIRETIHSKNSNELFNTIQWLSQGNEINNQYEQLDLLNDQYQETLIASKPRFLVYDQTHDNESFPSVNGIKQCLPIIGLLELSNFFKGTVLGFDSLLPEQLSVVQERRLYDSFQIYSHGVFYEKIRIGLTFSCNDNVHKEVFVRGSWDNWQQGIKCTRINDNTYLGLVDIKQSNTYYYKFIVNDIYINCYKHEKWSEWENHKFEITSQQMIKMKYQNLLYVRKIFNNLSKCLNLKNSNIKIQNHGQAVISVIRESNNKNLNYFYITRTAYQNDSHSNNIDLQILCPGIFKRIVHIFRISDEQCEYQEEKGIIKGIIAPVYEEFNLREYCDIYEDSEKNNTILHFFNMPPSLTIIIECQYNEQQTSAILNLEQSLINLQNNQELIEQFKNLTVYDINYLLFSSQNEELQKNLSNLYKIPNQQDYFFAGFASLFYDIERTCLQNNQYLPIFDNLKQGNWFMNYKIDRIKKNPKLIQITKIYEQIFNFLIQIPKELKPKYFIQFILKAKKVYIDAISKKTLNSFLFKNKFLQNLLLASYQFVAEDYYSTNQCTQISISAGLPHYSVGWTRQFGRDTFISFKGLLLIPSHFQQAKEIILLYGSCLRHGLIPNVLDNCICPRYNSRDSCWWFIKAVKDYIEFSRDTNILNENIQMKFLDDNFQTHEDLIKQGFVKKMTLQNIIQNIFQKHAEGIKFKEWYDGNGDQDIQEQGLNIELYLDETTGFIFGGNNFNCLTWMNLMGSCNSSKNKGIPANPRKGAPIEIIALLKYCLDFVINQQNYQYKIVKTKSGKYLSFKNWSKLIQQNFEKYFLIDKDDSCLYKDTYDPEQPNQDQYFRCNSAIAIAISPELFTIKKAIQNLFIIEQTLICENSLGIKTLSPQNQMYCPYYDKLEYSNNFKTSQGFSLHNGPEWIWVYGYFLLALYKVNKSNDNQAILSKKNLLSYLACHKQHISSNIHLGLPEMTNHDGEQNIFSCSTQASSISVILEVCFDVITSSN